MDTGSSTNLLSEELVMKLGLQDRVEKGTFRLIGVTGAPLQTLGIVRKLPVYINETRFESDFLVSNLANESCILGQTFMEDQNVISNFCNKVMHSPRFTAQLLKGKAKNRMFLTTENDCLITGLDVVSCNLVFEDSTAETSKISGLFKIAPTDELWFLHQDKHPDHDSTIMLNDGDTQLPFAIEHNAAEIWLPKNTKIAEVFPAFTSFNMIETEQSERSAKQKWKNDHDPERFAEILKALKIAENPDLCPEEKRWCVILSKNFRMFLRWIGVS
jgi:hypothetical protein